MGQGDGTSDGMSLRLSKEGSRFAVVYSLAPPVLSSCPHLVYNFKVIRAIVILWVNRLREESESVPL